MSRYHSYLNSAKKIIESYHGEEPFVFALKKFFTANKKIGSRDRKHISQLCYSYFRPGKAIPAMPLEERILTGYFLCTSGPDELLKELKPEWHTAGDTSIEQKISLLSFPVHDVFPWQDELSEGVDYEKFCNSFFLQPDLFIRIRPGNEKTVLSKLENAGLEFEQVSPNCIALPNSTKVQNVIELNKEAVIQDYNSQQVATFFPNHKLQTINYKPSVWDCCAASGGKSLLLYDANPGIDLTVSDIRENILANFRKRFREAGIKKYNSFVADLTGPAFDIQHFSKVLKDSFGEPGDLPTAFNFIIADVPCTGSGTWGRTPEQLFYFQVDKIDEYVRKQRKIVSNVIPALKTGGHLLYITCSVFKKENEEAVAFMQELGLELIDKRLLKGYDRKADTLFAALLQKPIDVRC